MPTLRRLTVAAALAVGGLAAVGLSPASGRQPQPAPAEAEVKALEQKLRALMAELQAREREAKAAAETALRAAAREREAVARAAAQERRARDAAAFQRAEAEAQERRAREALEDALRATREEEAKKKAADQTPKKADAPATPARPGTGWRVVGQPQPAPDAARAALDGLTKHPDPKVAAAAKELLDRLAKAEPPARKAAPPKAAPPKAGQPFEIEVVLDPGTMKPDGLPFDFKSGRLVIVADDGKKPGAAKPAAPAAATSLKMSADGKSAAVVSADGTVTVFDVATGRELMTFPGKK
jgi:hypothetical protein